MLTVLIILAVLIAIFAFASKSNAPKTESTAPKTESAAPKAESTAPKVSSAEATNSSQIESSYRDLYGIAFNDPSYAKRVGDYNTFKFEMPLTGSDAYYSQFSFDYRFRSVYHVQSSGKRYEIGHYKIDPKIPTQYNFYNNDGQEVGYLNVIDNDYYITISVSRTWIYEYYRDNQEVIAKLPKYLSPCSAIYVAEVIDFFGGGRIKDDNSSETIGYYSGNMVGAAACFCLASTELHKNTPYHRFIDDYVKEVTT